MGVGVIVGVPVAVGVTVGVIGGVTVGVGVIGGVESLWRMWRGRYGGVEVGDTVTVAIMGDCSLAPRDVNRVNAPAFVGATGVAGHSPAESTRYRKKW